MRRALAPSIALLLGVIFYLGRGPTRAEAALGIEDWGAHARAAVGPLVHTLPAWLRGCGPDAAWSFALASVLAAISEARTKTAWLAAGFVLAIGFELAQKAHLVSGTFDVLDLVAITLGYAAALVLNTNRKSIISGSRQSTQGTRP